MTRAELTALLEYRWGPGAVAENALLLNAWLDRGDGIAVYENAELGHPELGDLKLVSYGSAEAQLEPFCGQCKGHLTEAAGRGAQATWEHVREDHEAQYPPQRLPDNLPAGAINWRYWLKGTYDGSEGLL